MTGGRTEHTANNFRYSQIARLLCRPYIYVAQTRCVHKGRSYECDVDARAGMHWERSDLGWCAIMGRVLLCNGWYVSLAFSGDVCGRAAAASLRHLFDIRFLVQAKVK